MIVEPIQKKYLKVYKELIAEGGKIFEIDSIPSEWGQCANLDREMVPVCKS